MYDQDAAHSIGTSRIGSDASETEALFWAGLWRLSRNEVVPTVFVSDSRLVGDQAAGRCGSTIKDMPYYNLRAVFQALHAGLPGQGLQVEHVRSHTGDPFNELVDWIAKREPHESQYLPRQAVNMCTFQSILRHLWIATAQTPDVPMLTTTGYSVPPIALPPDQPVSTVMPKKTCKPMTFNISLGTANVRTFYRGEEGYPGKLQYVREQFQAHGLHFLGLQESRCDQGTSLQNHIYRIASGHHGGHLGVELWVNLDQPYAQRGISSRFFKRSDFVVVSQSPRHLLVHAQNEDLDFWLLSAHAPHGGTAQDVRESWWNQMSQLIHEHVRHGDLLTMIDANARSGRTDEIHVFENDDMDNTNTGLFREFLAEHNLCAPATAEQHEGERNTWIHPNEDREYRIDYVLVPTSWHASCLKSCSLDHLDFGHLGDHRAMAVELQWYGTATVSPASCTQAKYARDRISTISFEHALKHINHCFGRPTSRHRLTTSTISFSRLFIDIVQLNVMDQKRPISQIRFGNCELGSCVSKDRQSSTRRNKGQNFLPGSSWPGMDNLITTA